MDNIKTDLLVVGAGSGGLSVAAGAAQMGADVVLLEGHCMGGDCLNYGCVPSKALIAAGKVAHGQRHAAGFGIADQKPKVDYARVMAHVHEAISTIEPNDSVERFEGLGVRVIKEFGEFISPTIVRAGKHTISARRIVLATGSSPLVPPISGLDDVPYLTNETLWDMRDLPRHLIIIGAGPIGLEMAQAHRRLGAEVTVLEGARAMGRDDPEMAAFVLDALCAEGIRIEEDTSVSQVRGRAGAVEVETKDGRVFKGSHLLLAVGRKANIDRLSPEIAGIERSATGIKVDDSLRTTNRRVYAIGDVAGGAQFTHVAGYHAGVVVRAILFGLPAKAKTSHIPHATYTDPELAHIGLTEAEARKTHGDRLEVVRFDLAHNDRLIAERKARGLIKVMVVKGRAVGVSIVGPSAGEHINFWALVLANRLSMKQVSAMVSPYPTVGEIGKRAAGAYFSPRLFENPTVRRIVRFVQRWLP